jgi:hypothetical protein
MRGFRVGASLSLSKLLQVKDSTLVIKSRAGLESVVGSKPPISFSWEFFLSNIAA